MSAAPSQPPLQLTGRFPFILILREPRDASVADALVKALRVHGSAASLGEYADIHSATQNAQPFDLIAVLSSSSESRDAISQLADSLTANRMRRVVLVAISDEGDLRPFTAGGGFLRLRPEPLAMREVAERLVGDGTTPFVAGFEQTVAQALDQLVVPARSQVAAGGVRADFLIEVDDRRIVLEIKGRQRPSMLAIAEATLETQRIADAFGALFALTVFAAARLDQIAAGAVGIDELKDFMRGLTSLDAHVEQPSSAAYPDELEALLYLARGAGVNVHPRALEIVNPKSVFAAMPFSAEYEDVYFVAMTESAKAVDAACERLDHQEFVGRISARMIDQILQADALIADLSGANPNVMYELGYAHALEIPAIHISSTPLPELPFDVRDWNTIKYELGRTHVLRDKLTARLKAAFNAEGSGGRP
jgi:hypothetical protein